MTALVQNVERIWCELPNIVAVLKITQHHIKLLVFFVAN